MMITTTKLAIMAIPAIGAAALALVEIPSQKHHAATAFSAVALDEGIPAAELERDKRAQDYLLKKCEMTDIKEQAVVYKCPDFPFGVAQVTNVLDERTLYVAYRFGDSATAAKVTGLPVSDFNRGGDLMVRTKAPPSMPFPS